MALAQLREQREAVAVGQAEIEQDQGDVGLLGEQLHRCAPRPAPRAPWPRASVP